MRSRLAMGLMPLLLLALCSSAQAGNLQAKMDQYMQASMKVDHFMGAIPVARHGKVIIAKAHEVSAIWLIIGQAPDAHDSLASRSIMARQAELLTELREQSSSPR